MKKKKKRPALTFASSFGVCKSICTPPRIGATLSHSEISIFLRVGYSVAGILCGFMMFLHSSQKSEGTFVQQVSDGREEWGNPSKNGPRRLVDGLRFFLRKLFCIKVL